MKVISPLIITDAMVTSTTAVETVALWLNTTTYSLGAVVRFGNFIYESLIDNNVGNNPETNPTRWLQTGPTNRWAMFDQSNSTKTTAANSLEVQIIPDAIISSVAFFGLSGTELRLEVTDGIAGPVIYDKTVNLDNVQVFDWFMYFFEPFNFREDLVLFEIPPFKTAVYNVTLTGVPSVEIGTFIMGNLIDIGKTQYGSSVGIRDFSVKQTNEFGDTTFVRRAFSKRLDASVFVENTRLNYVNRELTKLRAIPAVWIGSEDQDFEATVVYGFYRDFNLDISYPDASLMRIEIDGLS